MKRAIRLITLLCGLGALTAADIQLFDMAEIHDESTLDIEVIQDWHLVEGEVPTRRKLITINVGEIWDGQDYRVPVKFIVPADRKATGFHLTGGSSPKKLETDFRIRGVQEHLLRGGVGWVTTVVQEPGTYGQRELGQASEARFARSLNPRHKIQYWAWPATLMRAITAAYAETDHFQPGKIAVTGSSKNGASPSMAIIHDQRMTAVHATVSPIWDSPLRHCDAEARAVHADAGGKQRGFAAGHFGPNFNQRALDAGHSWADLESFTRSISDGVFIASNLDSLRARGVEMMFHPGTHDFVAYDLAWGGARYTDIPIYLGANTGHGKKGHPDTEKDQQNKTAFLLRHFFPEEVGTPLLSPPQITAQVDAEAGTATITSTFPPDAGDESGRIFWLYDRDPDGSPDYLKRLIPDDHSQEMIRDNPTNAWSVTINLAPEASHIDVFTNHRKTIEYDGQTYPTYLSSPYTRVILKK